MLSVTCFAVAINSVISEISSPVRASLFVDDLAIYSTAYDAESACRYIQKSMNSISANELNITGSSFPPVKQLPFILLGVNVKKLCHI